MNPEAQRQQPEKHFVVELITGEKCDGILVNIDKLNYKIQLKNVKKYPAPTGGNEDAKPEEFDILNIDKANIKEVQLIQFEQKEDKSQEVNVNAIPQSKIPVNAQGTETKKTKNYDKNESFFDSLASMSHPQAKEESHNYNNKNKETFNLPNEPLESQGYQNNRGGRGRGGRGRGGYGRGQGGYGRGYHQMNQQGGYNQNQLQGGYNQGYYQNNYQPYQGYNKNYNQEGYNQNYNQGGFNQQQEGFNQGYNNYHHNQGRGRGRGGRGRGQGYNYNNRGAFYKKNFAFNQNPNQSQEKSQGQEEKIEPKPQDNENKQEGEKSIYDEKK